MPRTTFVILGSSNGTVQGDTAASPNTVAVRDNGGGLTLGDSTIAGFTLTGSVQESAQTLAVNGTVSSVATLVVANPMSAAISITLPLASTVPYIPFRAIRASTSTQNVTYTAAGTDLIYTGTGSASTFVQTAAGQQNVFISDGVAWYVK